MTTIRERVESGEVLLLDGGLATELEARGHDLDTALWSARLLIDAPDAIREMHRAYVEAGAECVSTATYQATEHLLAGGDAGAVRLAREAGARYVAASVGPYGATLANGAEFTGDYPGMDESALFDWHAVRFALLADEGPDVMACETIPRADEARALARLAATRPEIPVWFSFTCKDGAHLRDSSTLRDAVEACAEAPNVLAIGVNCTAPRHLDSLIAELRAASDHPIVVYPNSGEDFDGATRTWSGRSAAASFAEAARRWIDAGAKLVGGCCRTTPDHIRALARLLP